MRLATFKTENEEEEEEEEEEERKEEEIEKQLSDLSSSSTTTTISSSSLFSLLTHRICLVQHLAQEFTSLHFTASAWSRAVEAEKHQSFFLGNTFCVKSCE